jgi:hypothetical protein
MGKLQVNCLKLSAVHAFTRPAFYTSNLRSKAQFSQRDSHDPLQAIVISFDLAAQLYVLIE